MNPHKIGPTDWKIIQETQYDQLKQAIQVANPEIMELKFGCEIEVVPSTHFGQILNKKFGTSFWTFNDRALINEMGSIALQEYFRHKDCFKILGRPIRLADVLLALGEKYAFDGKGYLLERAFGTDDYNMAGMPGGWNLKDDNLDHQSEETKQFLIDLLIQPS